MISETEVLARLRGVTGELLSHRDLEEMRVRRFVEYDACVAWNRERCFALMSLSKSRYYPTKLVERQPLKREAPIRGIDDLAGRALRR